ncbi:MAG: glycosyltransferase family 2 protein [Pseudomonadales bacterium]|nr:glycosyltransferase family 2 protein [Pseudomonadales bacterium]
MIKPTISALIIAKNEEKMIGNCINSLKWCSEVIVIDDGSIDDTREIAESYGAKVISFKHSSFSRLREEALKRAKSEWVIYVDSDERVSPILAKEIMVNIETNSAQIFRLKRENTYFGKKLSWGGWQDDVLERVFKKDNLMGWSGDIHETPIYKGNLIDLKTKLIHFTHRDTISGLYKTASWTPVEAIELYKASIPAVTFFTLVRKGWMEFFRRAVMKKGYRDGMEGLIEAVIQAINRILVYIQVWEFQQNPTIQDRYSEKEVELSALWKNEHDLGRKK